MTNHEAALEAAAKHLYNNDPEGMNAQGFGEPWETFAPTNDIPAPYYRHLVNTAIREYQRQMAPAVREAVDRLHDAVTIEQTYEAERALLTLLNAHEEGSDG